MLYVLIIHSKYFNYVFFIYRVIKFTKVYAGRTKYTSGTHAVRGLRTPGLYVIGLTARLFRTARCTFLRTASLSVRNRARESGTRTRHQLALNYTCELTRLPTRCNVLYAQFCFMSPSIQTVNRIPCSLQFPDI
jgi:hypothetical protein